MNCESHGLKARSVLYQIGYTSRSISNGTNDDLGALCKKSTDHNQAIGVTGLLVYDGVRFMQVIEGDEVAVRHLMEIIASDVRHDKIVYMIKEATDERAFKRWGLACIGLQNNMSASHLLADVKQQVSDVKKVNVMASFIGFAALAK